MLQNLPTHGEWIVMIDGRSGSGKTSLAMMLADEARANVLHLEDLYPGWDGLREGSVAVAHALRTGTYRRYDWHLQRHEHTDRDVPSLPLIIEGTGALTSQNLAAARQCSSYVLGIWIDCPDGTRKRRALERDGDTFRPHWDAWAAQEVVHIRAFQPEKLADLNLRCCNEE